MPSLATITSNIFLAWLRFRVSWGKKNMPTPGRAKPASSAALAKKRWESCTRMPTPSPVSPSASLPARCSSFSTIFSASSTVRWLGRPCMSTTAPMPQASCSNSGR